jgi:hypothetical protein
VKIVKINLIKRNLKIEYLKESTKRKRIIDDDQKKKKLIYLRYNVYFKIQDKLNKKILLYNIHLISTPKMFCSFKKCFI